ncbi:MAG: hypothetical protein LBE06_00305 [Azoarcus sp.]|jgi:hypothetical protein|nr:hypothetical protein [Azoarcus sp.]
MTEEKREPSAIVKIGAWFLALISAVLGIVAAHMAASFFESEPDKPAKTAKASAPAAPTKQYLPDPHYIMKEGPAYGYRRQSGDATEIVMIYYMGEKDGRHQVMEENAGSMLVYECVLPCRYFKAMIFSDLDEPAIEVKRYETQPGSMIDKIMTDLMHKDIECCAIFRIRGKQYLAWFDEKKGQILTSWEKTLAEKKANETVDIETPASVTKPPYKGCKLIFIPNIDGAPPSTSSWSCPKSSVPGAAG